MPCRFRQYAGRGHPYVAGLSSTEYQVGKGKIVGGTKANVVVVIRPVVVPVPVEHTRFRGVVPVAGRDRKKHVIGPPLFGLRHDPQTPNPAADHRPQLIDEDRDGGITPQ